MSMNGSWYLALALVVALPLACSSDDDERAPVASSGTRNTGRAGSSSGGAGDEGGASAAAAAGQSQGGMPAEMDGGGFQVGDLDLGGALSIGGAAPNVPA